MPARNYLVVRRARRAYRAQAAMGARRLAAVARVGAKRAMLSRAYTGGALAAGALASYGAYRGIKRIRAARARAAKKRRIAYPVKRLACKKRITVFVDNVGKSSRTLYSERLTNITKGGTSDQRAYDIVNLKGFRVQINVYNQRNDFPISCTFAIVHKKDNGPPITTEFFRAYGDDRSMDFNTTRNFIELMQNPINTDLYEVLHRWNVTLNQREDNTSTSVIGTKRASEKMMTKYIPFKRQLRYDNTAAADAEDGEVYLVYWCDQHFQPAVGPVVANQMSVQIRALAFWNDAIR